MLQALHVTTDTNNVVFKVYAYNRQTTTLLNRMERDHSPQLI